MKDALRFSQLSPSLKALVRLCQDVNFGSILNIEIVDGDMSFDPQPEVMVDLRLDCDTGMRTETELGDFTLRVEVCRMLGHIDALKNGTIEKILVHSGIPRRLTMRRPLP